jgi:methionyl-tRNA formyltransferase
MRIVILCATRRGYQFCKKLMELEPEVELVIFSFSEDPWEPLFFEDLKSLAENNNQRFIEARNVAARKLSSFWSETPIDLMFCVSWRYMVPATIYNKPRLGTYVFHDSLLPKYRGFSPTVWAMINGELQTGVTLFEIAEEVDHGDIIDQEPVPIDPDNTIAEVLEKVTETYLRILERSLPGLLNGTLVSVPQNHAEATFTCKRLPEDNEISWHAPTKKIYDLIRAVTFPYPGAFTYLDGKILRIWTAERIKNPKPYVGWVVGRVIEIVPDKGAVVLTGDGALLITEVSTEDAERVCASEVLRSISQTLGR